MSSRLLHRLPLSSPTRGARPVTPPDIFDARDVADFFAALGGASLGDGAYRVHPPDTVDHWTAIAAAAFPSLEGQTWCFASDWLGRQFALTTERAPGSCHGICIIEPGSGSVYHTDHDFSRFHEQLLADEPEAALELELYDEWRGAGGRIPEGHECVEFVVPPFLGGAENVGNMAVTDMEVHWVLTAQLLDNARRRGPGSGIDDVRLR